MQATHSHVRVRRPVSFAERGAVVPFEAPALFAARVRADDRRGLVMLLSNFAENGSVYVVPWREAPRVLAVHGFDKLLHGAIDEARASTPQAVRAVVRQITGRVDGEGEQALRRDIQTRLLGCVLRDVGLDLALLGGGGHDARIAALLRMAASRIGPAAVDLLRRTEAVAGDLLPLGLPGTVGPMRQLHQDVVAFERHLRRCGETASAEARPYYQSMTVAAADAIELVGGLAFADRPVGVGPRGVGRRLDGGAVPHPRRRGPARLDPGRVGADAGPLRRLSGAARSGVPRTGAGAGRGPRAAPPGGRAARPVSALRPGGKLRHLAGNVRTDSPARIAP